jgi:zinc/manganese transport system substrate-binding protein
MHRRPLLALPITIALPGWAAGQAASVVASFSILGDMVQQIAGDHLSLRVIAGPETDAHAFQPRPSDAEALRGAAVLVRNGLGFDPWFDRLTRSAAGRRNPVIVTATEGIEPRSMPAHGHSHGPTERRQQHSVGPRRVADPHAWQDVSLAQTYIRNIARGLIAADPANAAAIERGAAAYAQRLAALDGWVRGQIATVPAERRRMVTTHDAFGYFAAAYGVTVLAAQGVSTASEPSAAAVGQLIRQVRAENITAVFVEAGASEALLERLSQEAGVRVRGRLYADTLSAPGGPAPTFEAMVRHNVSLMVPAMRGVA